MSGSVNRDIVCRWQEAVEAFERNDLEEAMRLFWDIRHFSAKIWFNLSTVDLLLGDYAAADEKLSECMQRDAYLAVAYFQRGVIACLQGRLPRAQEMFAEAQRNVRSGDTIDYRQLGLALRLTRQQMEYNQAVVESKLRGQNLATPTQMSVNELETLPPCVFRPARSLVDNLQKREFLQRSKVVSSVPDIPVTVLVSEKKSVLVSSQSMSAPSSPASLHKLVVGAPSLQGAHIPPPSRPPPRLPPAAAPRHAINSHHDNTSTDNTHHGDAVRSCSQVAHQAENCDQHHVTALPPNRYEKPNSLDVKTTSLLQRGLGDGLLKPVAWQSKGRNSLSNGRPMATSTSIINKGEVLNSVGAVRVESIPPVDMHSSEKMDSSHVQVRKVSEQQGPAGAVAVIVRQLNSGSGQGSNTARQEVEGNEGDKKQSHQGSVCSGQTAEVKGHRSGTSLQEASERKTNTKPQKAKPARPPPPKCLS